jgi:DNA-binding NarL/FixJ family response regulator
MKRFLLIDDHAVIRRSVQQLLLSIDPNHIVHEAVNPAAALPLLKQQSYDLLIMDVNIPGADMLVFMQDLRSKYPKVKVLVFSMSPEALYAKRFLQAGAMGFLPKSSNLDEIRLAIDKVLKGQKYISQDFAAELAGGTMQGKGANPFADLTSREFEIAKLLLEGKNSKAIAVALSLKPSTVSTHKGRIFEKLQVRNMIELQQLANSFNKV